MRIKFQLNRTDAKETGIYARFSINKKPIKIYLDETIELKFWSTKTKRAKQSSSFNGYCEFNSRLDDYEQKIKKICRKLLNDSDGSTISGDFLRKRIKEELFPDKFKKQTSPLTFFAEIIDESERGLRLNRQTPAI